MSCSLCAPLSFPFSVPYRNLEQLTSITFDKGKDFINGEITIHLSIRNDFIQVRPKLGRIIFIVKMDNLKLQSVSKYAPMGMMVMSGVI